LDQRYLFGGKFSTTEPLLFFLCLHAIILSLLSRSRTMASCPVKNARGWKYLSRLPRIILTFKRVKNADLSLCPNAISGKPAYDYSENCITNRFQAVFKSQQKSRTLFI
jgi:hypothetical protein